MGDALGVILPLSRLLCSVLFLGTLVWQVSESAAGELPWPNGKGQPPNADAPGSVDLTYDPSANGALLGFTGSGPIVNAVLLQPDGRILFGGWFNGADGIPRNSIARLNGDGSLDTNFFSGAGPDGAVTGIVPQSDGKVLIFGAFRTVDMRASTWVARLNPDGSVDGGFHSRLDRLVGELNAGVKGVAIQQNGKLWIGGRFDSVDGIRRKNLARLNSDGSLDTSFNPEALTGSLSNVTSIHLQADGKLLVAARATAPTRSHLVRLNEDGSMDTNFATVVVSNFFGGVIHDISCNHDGAIALCGWFTSVNDVRRIGVARLNSNGTLDSSFNPGAGVFMTSGGSVTIGKDETMVVASDFTTFNGVARAGVVRLNADGSVDAGFNANDATASLGGRPRIQNLFVAEDGSMLVAASASWDQENTNSLFRLNATGQRDAAVAPLLHAPPAAVGPIALQTDGKVLYATSGANSRSTLGRLNSNGLIDGAFVPALEFERVLAVQLQPDRKILIALTVDNPGQARLVRLLENGTVDESFHAPPIDGIGRPIQKLALQLDGKILLGGRVSNVENHPHQGIVRLHPDGSFDETFQAVPMRVQTDAPEAVEHILVRPDGKILIAGSFRTVNGGTFAIALLEPDGTVNPDFAANLQNVAGVFSLAAQPDGKIVLALGTGGTPGLIRINPDGSEDASFQPDLDGAFFAMALQADGQILVASQAFGFGRINRLHSDGTLDTSFAVDTFPNVASDLVLLPNGQILVAGEFYSVGGVPRHGIARLNNDLGWRLNLRRLPGSCRLEVTGRSGVRLLIEASSDMATWSQVGDVTTGVEPVTCIELEPMNASQRFYRARLAN